MENVDNTSGKIAIVGLDCRMPGANNVQEFWKNLVDEKESLVEFSDEQLKAAGVSPKTFNNPNYVRRRGVVEDADTFDAEFFNFTPREAELLDPQHRLFLECSWHALEDAGIDPYETDKKISIFGGTGSPYYLVNTINNKKVKKFASGTSIITSSDKDYVTTRVSYKLNLSGPSVNIQSACSTAMVGVVMGIDSLLNYQSDVVLAGGATVEVPVHSGYMYQSGGLESPDGKCRTFDKDASGTVFSRGAGVVALKRLDDAIKDKDHIYAVLLGGSVNNDGNRKAGYTAPSVQGQVEVITESIEMAGIDPATITMVEAHGTATPVGDPIEVMSLTKSFRQYTGDKQFCAIGSVKTNIGHTDVASAVASLIKTCMSLKHGIIPASLNYNEPNPDINFEESPFYVITKTQKWEKNNGTPRRALINSFGVGGTNACVILEEPPATKEAESSKDYDLLFVSAHKKQAYEEYCENLVSFLKENPEINLNALAHTSRIGRKAMKYKGAIAFRDYDDLLEKLGKSSPVVTATAGDNETVWMFPGQGNQFVNMGRSLYEQNEIFRETIDYCSSVLLPLLGLDIRKVIYPDEKSYEKAVKLIEQTYITQPAIFMVSYAMARVFQNYGLSPDKLVGHSVGEYVAAAVSGIMTLEDALKAIAFRGKLVFDLPEGSMLAVLMSEEEIKEILPESLDIAVINSPELVVVSGESPDIEAFAAVLKDKKVFNKILSTSHAFHSRMMAPSLDKYRDFFKSVNLQAPQIPVISTVTGKVLSDEKAQDHEYWVQHVIHPVRFSDSVTYLLSEKSKVFLECGPGQSLESAVKRRLKTSDKHAVIGTLNENIDAVTALDTALGKLWIENIEFDDEARFGSSGYAKVSYPLLPFQRRSFLVDFDDNNESAGDDNVKREQISDWFYVPSWKKTAPVEMVPSNKKAADGLTEKWVILGDNPFSKSIAEQLGNIGKECYTVSEGDHFTQNGNAFSLRINEKEDFVQLFSVLPHEESSLHIIHIWNYSNDEEEISLQNAEAVLDRSFYSLIYLEQGLIVNNLVENVHITCLINDGFDITGSAKIRPEKSLSTGPMRVLFKEHEGMSTRLVNLSSPVESAIQDRLIQRIIKETQIETDETIVSYSGLTRWTESFETVSLPETDNPAGLLKDRGVYLITGGTGGIGRTLSLMIAEKVKCTLIWTGRNPLPAEEEWDSILADSNADSNTVEKIKTIRQVGSLGSKIKFYRVNVSDLERMREVFEDVESTCGSIDGIIHSAGIAGGGVVALKEQEEANKVLRSKVQGTLVLKELIKDKNPDFVYLFSSITAILGEAGRVDYISANAFMDAVSNSEFLGMDKNVCSVNWGQWGITGMAADWQKENALRKKGKGSPKEKPVEASPANHPVNISLIESKDNKEIFAVDVNADEHWIINEHLLSGVPTMVGTSYLEMLIKWKEFKNLQGGLTVKNAAFSSPLMFIGKSKQELHLVCEKKGEGQYHFVFRSTGSLSGEKEHFSGDIILQDGDKPGTVDLSKMAEKFGSPAEEHRHFLSLRDGNNKMMLQYSDRWDCKGSIYSGNNEWLLHLDLPEKFAADLETFQVHPSMLDVVTSAHFMHRGGVFKGFLPYSYGEVDVYRPFEQHITCHTKTSESQDEDGELIYFDFDLFSDSGEPIMSIKNYAFVSTGDIDTGEKEEVISKASKTEAVEYEDDDILPDEGKEAFEMLIQNEGLPQVIIYTKDLKLDFKESKVSFIRAKLLKKKMSVETMEDVDDRPEIDTPYEAPDNEIEKSIAAIWTSILGINKIGANDSFNELGGNSLLAIQVIAGIGDEFGVEIKAGEFVNNATVHSLSELVLVKILEEHDTGDIEKLLNAETL